MDLRVFQEREIGLDIYNSGFWALAPVGLAVVSVTVFLLSAFCVIQVRRQAIAILLAAGLASVFCGTSGAYIQYKLPDVSFIPLMPYGLRIASVVVFLATIAVIFPVPRTLTSVIRTGTAVFVVGALSVVEYLRRGDRLPEEAVRLRLTPMPGGPGKSEALLALPFVLGTIVLAFAISCSLVLLVLCRPGRQSNTRSTNHRITGIPTRWLSSGSIVLSLLPLLASTSCRSVSQDLFPDSVFPSDPLLPALEVAFEQVFDPSDEFATPRLDPIQFRRCSISHLDNWLVTKYLTRLVHGGEKRGILRCVPLTHEARTNLTWSLLLFTQLFGVPGGSVTVTVNLKLEILSKQGAVLRRFYVSGTGTAYQALFWGFKADQIVRSLYGPVMNAATLYAYHDALVAFENEVREELSRRRGRRDSAEPVSEVSAEGL
jgi:hypothetical protein